MADSSYNAHGDTFDAELLSSGKKRPKLGTLPQPTSAQLSTTKIDSAAGGDVALITATALQVGRLYRLLVVASADCTLIFKDGSTALTGAITVKAGSGFILDFDGEPWFTTTVNTALNLTVSAAVQISGIAYFTKG